MKKKNILIFIVILIAVAAVILPKPLNNLDEIWNYNFARNVVDGNVPYRDFNMIQMPFFPMICAIFLKLFGNELIVMRCLGIVLGTGILYTTYKILDRMIDKKEIIYIILIFFYYLFVNYFSIDYNFMILLIALVLMYWEIKGIEKEPQLIKINWKRDIFLGILAGIAITLKQSTGLILVAIFVGYKWILIRNTEDLKTVFKISLIRGFSALLPLAIAILYLLANGAISDFIDYCILGISTFSNNIPYTGLLESEDIAIKVLSICVPLTIILAICILIKEKIKNVENKILFIMLMYALSTLIVIYPIADNIHFLIGSLPTILTFIYILYKKPTKLVLECIAICFTLIILLYSFKHLGTYFFLTEKNKTYEHYKYINTSSQNQSIKEIGEYITKEEAQGNQVYILDPFAAIYRIPLNKYHKNYDMLLNGNLGKNGAEGVVESIKNENENSKILILNEKYKRNWQTPMEVIYYIKENMEKTGEINIFDIYEKVKI